jgi:hypothetical protein
MISLFEEVIPAWSHPYCGFAGSGRVLKSQSRFVYNKIKNRGRMRAVMKESYLLRKIVISRTEIPFLHGQLIYDYEESSGHIELIVESVSDQVQKVLKSEPKFKIPVSCVTQEFYRMEGLTRCFQVYENRFQLQFPLDTKLNKEAFSMSELLQPYELVELEYKGQKYRGYLANWSRDGNMVALKDRETMQIRLFPLSGVKITLLDSGLKG